ncbi:hypothetical protein A2U01_0000277 [Trifolium medium]|uniref:Uncharacterized protein n=1 Tax=Trifolium medium TaxID=97028 RepID=A0A392LX71_9FABA|nr:hypothetical protein [Trifolium medium]
MPQGISFLAGEKRSHVLVLKINYVETKKMIRNRMNTSSVYIANEYTFEVYALLKSYCSFLPWQAQEISGNKKKKEMKIGWVGCFAVKENE